MKQLFSAALVFTCVSLFAQNAPPPQQNEEGDAQKVTLTGCLDKSNAANEYQITDQKSGEKVPFGGPAKLDKYVNQTVKLSGKVVSQGSDKVFKPETISQVSPSCEKSQ